MVANTRPYIRFSYLGCGFQAIFMLAWKQAASTLISILVQWYGPKWGGRRLATLVPPLKNLDKKGWLLCFTFVLKYIYSWIHNNRKQLSHICNYSKDKLPICWNNLNIKVKKTIFRNQVVTEGELGINQYTCQCNNISFPRCHCQMPFLCSVVVL